MGGESSSTSIDSLQDMPTGTESEMLRIAGAQLYLLDGEESVRMGTGDFSLIMIVQAKTPLATLVAQVAEFQWPIGKDAPVLKIANLRYTFAMPGLLYGLILPDNTALEFVQRFESHLQRYCTFELRPEIAKAAGLSQCQASLSGLPSSSLLTRNGSLRRTTACARVSDLQLWSSVGRSVDGASEGARYWTAVADDVESYSGKLVRQMQNGSKVAARSILKGGEWATWGIQRGGSYVKNVASPAAVKSDGEGISSRMRGRVDQARRMSAVAKLLSRTVLKGAISATGHVANFLGMAISETPPVRAFMSNDARREVVVASVDAFAQVVEAVETAGKSLATVTGSVGTDIVQHKFGEEAGQVVQDGMGAMGNMIDSMWTLNKLGLYMLWRATTASTVLNYGFRNGGTSRSASGTSSDTSRRSPRTMKSTSPGKSNNSVNTIRQPSLSIGRTMSLSTPMAEDDVPRTAQLFPNTPGQSQSQFYAATPPLYMHHPQTLQTAPSAGYASYYHTQPSTSPFQQYTRPAVTPTVQPFFPHDTEVAKPQ